MNERPTFAPVGAFRQGQGNGYDLLPFRYVRLPDPPGTVLITSETGEYAFLTGDELVQLIAGGLPAGTELFNDLRARRFLIEQGGDVHLDLWAAQLRTRKAFLRHGPTLHIFVVTLRCDHSCVYCQVSRRSTDARKFDMSDDTIEHALDRLFEGPAPAFTVEFQGGEPALAFDTVRDLVLRIEERNEVEQRDITFSMVSTLHLMTEEMLVFCRDHRVGLSTSVDGPAFLHNANRPNRTRDSFEKTVEAIHRAREVVGADGIAAMTTLTRASLDHPREIIDTYIDLGFRSIFLRPVSPYGFAVRSAAKIGYSMTDFVAFYRKALDYLLALNVAGTVMDEVYTAILLQHILTPYPSGYMDLRSPAAAGLGSAVYNYDGRVFASDEGRMLAETGDDRFVLGTVDQPARVLHGSEAMRWLLASSVAEALPGCSDCAFLPYCGADPVFHTASQDDPVGHRPTSDFCTKHTGLFEIIFGHLARKEPDVLRVFTAWMTQRSAREIAAPGFFS